MKNKAGKVIGSSYAHDVLTSLENKDVMLVGLAEGLQGLKKGEKRVLSVAAEQAYGLYDPKKVFLFPRKKFPRDANLNNGASVVIVSKSGTPRTYKVVQTYGEMISLDGNHPLAGQDLIFEIEALAARDATLEEVSASNNMVATQYFH